MCECLHRQARFEAAGYALPQVVFWNLSDSSVYGKKSTPITMHEKGACLVSGFRWGALQCSFAAHVIAMQNPSLKALSWFITLNLTWGMSSSPSGVVLLLFEKI